MAKTPFGEMQSDEGLDRAPTQKQVSMNPGDYSGTNWDPVNTLIGRTVVQRTSTKEMEQWGQCNTFAEYFSWDPVGALDFWYRHTGYQINFSKFSPEQRQKCGLPPV